MFSYQEHFIALAVKEFWKKTQRETLQTLSGKRLVLAGDGRNDSPGHTSMFCSYTLADCKSKKIISVKNRDVRHAKGKSANMELMAFELATSEAIELGKNFGVEMIEIATDAHSSIAAAMKRGGKFKGIKHSLDVWHGSKNITSRLVEASNKTDCEDLADWAPMIRRHFWYRARKCEGSVERMKCLWNMTLHHVINRHSWGMPLGFRGPLRCKHDDLTEDEIAQHKWLKPNSPAFKELKNIIKRPYLWRNMHYYVRFRHTGFLESYHSLILVYAPKRFAFSYQSYNMRIVLACIDHNYHTDRKQATTKDGKLRDTRAFSKRTKAWYVVPVFEPKDYAYIPDLMRLIFSKRENFTGSMKKRKELDSDHPKRIHRNRGMVDGPASSTLREMHTSRFK